MKITVLELLQQYEKGKRDFSGVSLVAGNLKQVELEEIDLRGCLKSQTRYKLSF